MEVPIVKRREIIAELKKYFAVKELVCDHVYAKLGEGSWQVFPTFVLENLLFLRAVVLKKPMVCNTKELHQRGFRCNRCEIVRGKEKAYVSGHVLGLGWDFTVLGMTAEAARNLIRENASRFPHPFRIERDVNWLHFDCVLQDGVDEMIHEFKG